MDQLWKISCMSLFGGDTRSQSEKTGEKEINFIARKGASVIYVQVYLPTEIKECIIERKFGAYEGIKDNFPKYVLSLNNFDMSRNGNKH